MPEITLAEVGCIVAPVSVIHRKTGFLVFSVHGNRGEVLHVGSPTLVLRHTCSQSESWGEKSGFRTHKSMQRFIECTIIGKSQNREIDSRIILTFAERIDIPSISGQGELSPRRLVTWPNSGHIHGEQGVEIPGAKQRRKSRYLVIRSCCCPSGVVVSRVLYWRRAGQSDESLVGVAVWWGKCDGCFEMGYTLGPGRQLLLTTCGAILSRRSRAVFNFWLNLRKYKDLLPATGRKRTKFKLKT